MQRERQLPYFRIKKNKKLSDLMLFQMLDMEVNEAQQRTRGISVENIVLRKIL